MVSAGDPCQCASSALHRYSYVRRCRWTVMGLDRRRPITGPGDAMWGSSRRSPRGRPARRRRPSFGADPDIVGNW